MSRLTTLGVFLLDAVATMTTFLQTSFTLLAVCATLLTSCLLALTSQTVQSLLWPRYFWDE